MKRLSKIMLLVSGICGALGVVFLIAGLVLGVSTAQFWNSLKVNIPHLFPLGRYRGQSAGGAGRSGRDGAAACGLD